MKKPIPDTNMIFHWNDDTLDSSSVSSRFGGTVLTSSSLTRECMNVPVNG